MSEEDHETQLWKLVGVGAGLGAGLIARKGMERVWLVVRGEEPPSNPASSTTNWTEALIWAAASGVALAVTRLVAQRGAAEAWRAFTGSYRENLEVVRA